MCIRDSNMRLFSLFARKGERLFGRAEVPEKRGPGARNPAAAVLPGAEQTRRGVGGGGRRRRGRVVYVEPIYPYGAPVRPRPEAYAGYAHPV